MELQKENSDPGAGLCARPGALKDEALHLLARFTELQQAEQLARKVSMPAEEQRGSSVALSLL